MAQNELPYIILGAGGHARVLAGLLEKNSAILKGFLDTDNQKRDIKAENILNYPVLGNLDYLDNTEAKTLNVALGIGNNYQRAAFFQRFESQQCFPPVIHPTAFLENYLTVGLGTVIAVGAIIGVAVSLGKGIIVNSGAIIDHEGIIGDFAHISPGVKLAGKVKVGDYTHIGIGSSVIERVTIGSHSIIGAGSVVINDIPDGVLALGVPARVIRSIK